MASQRYPISARLVGVMQKEKTKMYIVSVLWSDQNDIVIYRTFQDFQKMHKQLKKAFPPLNKLKKSDRIVPVFQGKKVMHSGQKKGPSRSLVHLKHLQKYCNELLSCDPRVSQSADLIQFFHPKDQDLQPEFSKNGIMITPSDEELKSDSGHGGGTVTQPFVTETYRCVASYETKCTKNKPFKVAQDEKLDVLIKDKAGWWLVENEDKRMAWFPAPYLDKLDDDDDLEEDEIDEIPGRGVQYTAVKNYKATKGDEISVSMGATVEVLQMNDNGWWFIRYNGQTGYIPAMYLKPSNYPYIHTVSQEQPSSSLEIPSPSLTQSHQLSRSQGNLLLVLPPASPSSPHQLEPKSKQKSRSLNMLSERSPSPRIKPPAFNTHSTTRPTAIPPPPPAIMVEMHGEQHEEAEERGRSLKAYSQSSFESDSTEFSFSDDFSSSSGGSSLNLSATDEQLRLTRTPPPPRSSSHLSPTSPEGRLMPSVSDPNLYKGPTSPKVPPRPRAHEILNRCSTITRKNLTKASQSPTEAEILSH